MTAVAMDGPDLVTSQNYFAVPGDSGGLLQVWDADSMLTGNIIQHPNVVLATGSFAAQISVDASGALWVADEADRCILRATGVAGSSKDIFKKLNYVPTGIAVDSARGLIYVSDFTANQIHVLNGKGQLIAIIQ